jgi:cyclic dehypoxanthinyl futalosine synthase
MVSGAEALELFQSNDLVEIGMRADEVRRRLHPGGVVSYLIERTLNGADREAIFDRIQETVNLGGTGISIQDGFHREIESYEELLRDIKKRFAIHCRGLSAAEISHIAAMNGLSVSEIIVRLKDAGLDSIAGAGEGWAEVHRAAHGLGMRTTATILFRGGETSEQRLSQLELVRQIQEDTGGFSAFIPSILEETTAVEYLKMLAISRIYLDNIVNIQSCWVTAGLKTCQVGLRFGANDVGGILIGTGAQHTATEEELRRLIRDAGFVPKQRDTLYSQYFLN